MKHMQSPHEAQQQQQHVYFQVKYSLHGKLVPAISEGYSRRVQEKKGKFYNGQTVVNTGSTQCYDFENCTLISETLI